MSGDDNVWTAWMVIKRYPFDVAWATLVVVTIAVSPFERIGVSVSTLAALYASATLGGRAVRWVIDAIRRGTVFR